jgi:hypothetical protein
MNSAAHKSTDIAFFKQHWFSKPRPQMKKTERDGHVENFHLLRVHMIMGIVLWFSVRQFLQNISPICLPLGCQHMQVCMSEFSIATRGGRFSMTQRRQTNSLLPLHSYSNGLEHTVPW